MDGSTIDSRMAGKGDQVCGGGDHELPSASGWEGSCGTSTERVLNRPPHRWSEAGT